MKNNSDMDSFFPIFVILLAVGLSLFMLVVGHFEGYGKAMKEGLNQGYVEKVITIDDKVEYVWKKKL